MSVTPYRPLEEKLDLDQPQWSEIHVVTGALKMFFRELPEPLFPLHFFQSVVDVLSEFNERGAGSLFQGVGLLDHTEAACNHLCSFKQISKMPRKKFKG